MKAKVSILCLVTLMLFGNVNAQLGYLRKGSLYIQGNVFDQGIFKNNRKLLLVGKMATVAYSPDQVEEYGFINGDVYIKRAVQDEQRANNYFLLRLVDGDRTLYELKERKGSRFFIEHDSALVEIKREVPLRDQLSQQLKPCSSNQRIAASARFGTSSLKRAVLMGNACYAGFFPTLRLGALAGYEFCSQSLGSTSGLIFLQATAFIPVVGVFVEIPLTMSPSWFFNAQITYQQSNFNKFQIDNNGSLEYQDNFSSIGFPLLFKYRGRSSSWRPFMAMGPIPALCAQQQNVWLTTTYHGQTVYVNQGSWDNIKKFQISGALCAGIEYSIKPTKAVSLELRYKKLIDAQVGPSQSVALLGSFYF